MPFIVTILTAIFPDDSRFGTKKYIGTYKRHRMFDTAKLRFFWNNAVRFFCQKLL